MKYVPCEIVSKGKILILNTTSLPPKKQKQMTTLNSFLPEDFPVENCRGLGEVIVKL